MVRPWLERDTSLPRLLENVAGTLAGVEMAWGLAGELFSSTEDFYAAAESWQPEDHEEQYAERVILLKGRGLTAAQTEFWRTESACRRLISDAALSCIYPETPLTNPEPGSKDVARSCMPDKIAISLEDIGPIVIVVSRDEVERCDISGPLSTLRHLVSSPELIRECRERVAITFDGYNETYEELFDIPSVRNFVHALDLEFPYWLYFLSRSFTSLQCIALCFLLPFLTEEARRSRHPEQLRDLMERHWGPALNQLCNAASIPDSECDELLESALRYFIEGPTVQS